MRISALGKLFVSDAQPASHLLYVNAAGRFNYRSMQKAQSFTDRTEERELPGAPFRRFERRVSRKVVNGYGVSMAEIGAGGRTTSGIRKSWPAVVPASQQRTGVSPELH